MKSIKTRQEGIKYAYYDFNKKQYVEGKCLPGRGIGTKAYTIRRIQLLEDKLKELKQDLDKGKYDFKG